jgi:hypothetical protein
VKVSHKILGFRARAMSFGLMAAGFAVLLPRRATGALDFATTPAALPLFGLGLVTLGSFIEETGTLRRIRAGLAVRLAGAACAFVSVPWAGLADRSTLPWGWALVAIGGALVALAAQVDLRHFRDTRAGQSLRLESLDDAAMTLTAGGQTVRIPLDAITAVALGRHMEGRGVHVVVGRRDRIQGDVEHVPFTAATRIGDELFLTEHQCNRDAEELVAHLTRALALAPERYR